MECIKYFFPKTPVEDGSDKSKVFRKLIVNFVVGHIVALILSIIFVTIATCFL